MLELYWPWEIGIFQTSKWHIKDIRVIIHMATSKSRKLNILCIMSKIRAFFVDLRSVMSYSHVCGKHLHEGTIAIRGVSDYTTGLTSPFFHLCACTKPGKWAVMYMFAKGIEFAPFYNFLIGFGTVPTVW